MQKRFCCQNCGLVFNKWQGKCSECSSWGSIIEEIKKTKSVENKNITLDSLNSLNLKNVANRINTNIKELNRLFGGGIVHGSSILVSGEPGIGKSTLVLQLCSKLSSNSFKTLYLSGEESLSQIKLRSNRLNINGDFLYVGNIVELNEIMSAINNYKPNLIIIDSIQTLYFENIESPPGSISQIKVCAHELITKCKNSNITLVIIGHINKEGQIAGPKILEHMVDVVLSFENEYSKQFRIVRATKNRYGSTNEIAIFEMSEEGLNEISNPSELFLSNYDNFDGYGKCIFSGIEGTRPIMLEIQALVVKSFLPMPKRSTLGYDNNRLSMLLAVLNSKLNIKFFDKEVYLNIVGGLKLTEPAVDLAIVAALISALKEVYINPKYFFFGEVGLSGEVRRVNNTENRLLEATKLGFKKAIIPIQKKKIASRLEIIELKHIKDLENFLLNDEYNK